MMWFCIENRSQYDVSLVGDVKCFLYLDCRGVRSLASLPLQSYRGAGCLLWRRFRSKEGELLCSESSVDRSK